MEINKEILELFDKFINFLDEKELLGAEETMPLLEAINNLRDILETKIIPSTAIVPKNPIEVLGLAPRVKSFFEQGYSTPKIAEAIKNIYSIEIKEKDITDFIENYGAYSLASSSVFDVETEMQRSYEELIDYLEDIKSKPDEAYKNKKITKDEIFVNYLREKRQMLMDSANLMEQRYRISNIEKALNLIIEEINKESPLLASRVYKRLQDAKILFEALDL